MSELPGECAVALKEWAGVCAGVAAGRQTVLLRKGGIREQAGAFVPEHPCFWLYPTHLHESQQGLRGAWAEAPVGPVDPAAPVSIRGLARIDLVAYVTSEAALPELERFHVWTPETIARRFRYRRPGLWVLGVRVFLRDDPWILVPTSVQLGCQSWVNLDQPVATAGLRPVLDAGMAAAERHALETALARWREVDS